MSGLRLYNTLADVPSVYDAAGNPTRTINLDGIPSANIQDSSGLGPVGTTLGAAAVGGQIPLSTSFQFNIVGGADFTIHVIRNVQIELSGTGSFDIEEDGVHVYFVNCTFTTNNWTATNADDWWLTREISGSAGGNDEFTSGTSTLRRPDPFNASGGNTAATNRSFNFFGCDILVGAESGSARDLRWAVSDMYDTVFRQTTPVVGRQSLVYPKGDAIWNNASFQTAIEYTIGNRAALLISGSTDFVSSDFRGYALSVVDTARVKFFAPRVAPGGVITGFNTGNSNNQSTLPNNGRSYAKSVNPLRTIPAAGDTTSLTYRAEIPGGGGNRDDNENNWRQNCRYVELQQWIADYNEIEAGTVSKADGIGIVLRPGYAIPTADDYTTLTVGGSNPSQAYRTNAQGLIAGDGLFIPDTGGTGTIAATDGLQIPVASFFTVDSTNTNAATLTNTAPAQVATSAVEVRSYFHDLEETFPFSKPILETRAAGDDAGTAITANASPLIDANLRNAALYTSGTTKRLPAEIVTYRNGLFAAADPASPQELYETLKSYRTEVVLTNDYRTNFNRPTVTGGTVTWDGTLNLSLSGSAIIEGANAITVPGTSFQAVAGDPVTALDITTIDLNNGRLLVDTTATVVRDPGLVANGNDMTPDLSNEVVLDGVFNVPTIEVISGADTTIVLGDNIQFNTPCTINNANPAGTVTIRQATLGNPGATVMINNLTAGTNTQFQEVPIAQTELSIVIPSNTAYEIAWTDEGVGQLRIMRTGSTSEIFTLSTANGATNSYDGTTDVVVRTVTRSSNYVEQSFASTAGQSISVDAPIGTAITGIAQATADPMDVVVNQGLINGDMTVAILNSDRGARRTATQMLSAFADARVSTAYISTLRQLIAANVDLQNAALQDTIIITQEGPDIVEPHVLLTRATDADETQVVVNGRTVNTGGAPFTSGGEVDVERGETARSEEINGNATVIFARRADGVSETQVKTQIDNAINEAFHITERDPVTNAPTAGTADGYAYVISNRGR